MDGFHLCALLVCLPLAASKLHLNPLRVVDSSHGTSCVRISGVNAENGMIVSPEPAQTRQGARPGNDIRQNQRCLIIDVSEYSSDARILLIPKTNTMTSDMSRWDSCIQLLIYDGNHTRTPPRHNLIAEYSCRNPAVSSLISWESLSSTVTVRLITSDDTPQDKHFKLFYSVYRTSNSCDNDEFLCDNKRCIPLKHTCDDTMHCLDGTDENIRAAGCGFLGFWICFAVVLVLGTFSITSTLYTPHQLAIRSTISST